MSENMSADARTNQHADNPEQIMAQINAYSLAQSFVMMLAQKAWVCLGKIAADPKTNEIKVDLPQAQFSIDCIAAIHEKMKGRVPEKELGELQSILTNLRLNYVGAMNESQAAGEQK